MDALELLKSDHERVNALFDQLELAQEPSEKRQLLEKVRQELELHAYLEEKILYPYFAEKDGFQDEIARSYDDHQEVKDLLEEIVRTPSGSSRDDKISELIDCVESHVKEEEEDLFPKIEKTLDTVQLMQMGAQIEEAKGMMSSAAA